MDIQESDELVKRREAKIAAEKVWLERLRETLDEFPVVPFGTRIVLLQRQPEHLTKGGLLLPQTKDAPLSGYVVAVPEFWKQSSRWTMRGPRGEWLEVDELHLPNDRLCVRIGDEVLFPDFAAHRISVMVGLPGEEQRQQEFLVIDARDLHGKVSGGGVDSLAEVVPGLEEPTYVEGGMLGKDAPQ